MEQTPKPSQPLGSYEDNGRKFHPESIDKQRTRTQVSSWIHNMTVSSTEEWDKEMHPQVDRLKVGETTVITGNANEYLKVTRISGTTFDVEYGTYDDM